MMEEEWVEDVAMTCTEENTCFWVAGRRPYGDVCHQCITEVALAVKTHRAIFLSSEEACWPLAFRGRHQMLHVITEKKQNKVWI